MSGKRGAAGRFAPHGEGRGERGNGVDKTSVSVFLTCLGLAAAAAGEQPLEARATLSYHGTGGNTQNHGGAAAGEAEYARGRWIIDGGGDYSISVSDGEKKGESAGLSAGAKYFLTGGDRLYGRYKAEWRRNVFSGFEHRFSNFAGLGAYLIKSDPQELTVEGGPNYVNERYRDDSEKSPASFVGAHAGVDYQVFLNGAAEVEASAVWDVDLGNTAEQLLTGKATLRVKVATWLDLAATEKIDWDNVPPEGYGELDVTTTVGLTVTNY
jgi:putative salt-induced outer membrane protein YdiY